MEGRDRCDPVVKVKCELNELCDREIIPLNVQFFVVAVVWYYVGLFLYLF